MFNPVMTEQLRILCVRFLSFCDPHITDIITPLDNIMYAHKPRLQAANTVCVRTFLLYTHSSTSHLNIRGPRPWSFPVPVHVLYSTSSIPCTWPPYSKLLRTSAHDDSLCRSPQLSLYWWWPPPPWNCTLPLPTPPNAHRNLPSLRNICTLLLPLSATTIKPWQSTANPLG